MTIENVPMFDVVPLTDITVKHVKEALDDSVNPQTGEYDVELEDFTYGELAWVSTRGETVPGLGTFFPVTSWSGGDGHEQGAVVRHKESGKFFMVTGIYSSWDASEWDDVVEATPYEFTETRYKAV